MKRKEIHSYASAIHGFLVFGHLLGVIYNFRRKNWRNVALHSCALAFDVNCVKHHIEAGREE